MSYERTDMRDDGTREPSTHRRGAERFDAVSVGAGLLFVAIAVLALADRRWTEFDPVLMVGGAVIAVGLGMIAEVIRRAGRDGEGRN